MKIIQAVLSSSHFENKPPVLIDIGASGEINKKWRPIAPYSICIAFDADDREFNVSEKQASWATMGEASADRDEDSSSDWASDSYELDLTIA